MDISIPFLESENDTGEHEINVYYFTMIKFKTAVLARNEIRVYTTQCTMMTTFKKTSL